MNKFLLILFIFFASNAAAQPRTGYIRGRVLDEDGKPLFMASVKITETNQITSANSKGDFIIGGISQYGQTLTLEVSYVGTKAVSLIIPVKNNNVNTGVITLKKLNLGLADITVTAKRDYKAQSNSSVIINRDVIEQMPALSLSDILNLLPNKKIVPPSLQNVQSITLRGAYQGVTSGRSAFEQSNSFGVAIIMDGSPISNNSNMQSLNVGRGGSTGSSVSSGGYSGDYAFQGTDLRQIPVENIETIEVISGVAPVKYGDLTDGAVIIERRAGAIPATLRTQIRESATSYSLSSGFLLNKKLGTVNVGLNYTQSFQDNRDKLKAYHRINTSAIWSNSYGAKDQLKNTISIDYGRNLDGIKQDPDDPYSQKVSFNNWSVAFTDRTSYRIDHSFFKNIGLNFRYSTAYQNSYTEQYVNDGFIVYTNSTQTGITEGSFAPGIYTAVSQVEGKPVDLSARLELNAEARTFNINHYLSAGYSFNYSANKGRGQLVDPQRPGIAAKVTGKSTEISSRYYDYRLVKPQQDAGIYLQDAFKVKLWNRDLNVTAGARADLQNGYTTVSPRINTNYDLGKNLKIGLAYGLATKAPGLGQRFPGPVYTDIPLLVSFNGKVSESTYLLYVNRYDPTNENLKPSRSRTFETSLYYSYKKYNFSLSVFDKNSTDGISTIVERNALLLPTYKVTPQTGQKPLVEQNGSAYYPITYQTFANPVTSNNKGFDIVAQMPVIKAISTSFSASGGLYRSYYYSNTPTFGSRTFYENSASLNYAVLGVYEPTKRVTYFSSGRLIATTHIPRLRFIVQLIAEFDFMNKTKTPVTSGVPLGYYTRDGRFTAIENFDISNVNYGHLLVTRAESEANNQVGVYRNFHLNLSKEIKNRLKLSFNVYNFLNYIPRYKNSVGSLVIPNSPPSFGAELSVKI